MALSCSTSIACRLFRRYCVAFASGHCLRDNLHVKWTALNDVIAYERSSWMPVSHVTVYGYHAVEGEDPRPTMEELMQ